MKEENIESRLIESRKRLSEIENQINSEKVSQRALPLSAELEISRHNLLEKVGILESEQRKNERAKYEDQIKDLLLQLRDNRLDEKGRFDLLLRAARITMEIRELMGFRIAYSRIDMAKCLVIDEVWRSRCLPQTSQSLTTQMGKKPNEGMGVNPIYSKEPVYTLLPFVKAERLEKEKKVQILSPANGQPPQFEERYIQDHEPEILQVLEAVDFGKPIELGDGKYSCKEIARAVKDNFLFRLSVVDIERQLIEEGK